MLAIVGFNKLVESFRPAPMIGHTARPEGRRLPCMLWPAGSIICLLFRFRPPPHDHKLALQSKQVKSACKKISH